MYIGVIKYGKSFEHFDGLWEKIGVEVILNDTDTPENGIELARNFVNSQLSIPVKSSKSEEISYDADHVFIAAKMQIEQTQYREDAEEVMNAAGFRFNVELKNIVNSKPSRQ